MNEKVTIRTESGDTVEALAPVIISASRSTDIPAFYAKWFVNRLKAGYCVWYNPFNRKPEYVSFSNCKVVVFWTKNPKPLMPYLQELNQRGIHYYFQYTLNDYVSEGFEPNVGDVDRRIETFKNLSSMIGKEKVIWRFDPLIVTPKLGVKDLLTKIWMVGNKLKGYTDKLVFSFVDVNAYRKVQNNLIKEIPLFSRESVKLAELDNKQMDAIAIGLAKCRDRWRSEGWSITISSCAEKIDLCRYGIEHNRCIDGDLIERLFPEDKGLVYYLHAGELPESNLFGNQLIIPSKCMNLKDKGQRLMCGCMVSKDIGMYNTCRHFCVYCYANSSRDVVIKNQKRHFDDSESIID